MTTVPPPVTTDTASMLRLLGAGAEADRISGPTLLLNDPDTACVVRRGSLDVFAVRLAGDQVTSRWTFVGRVGAGELVIGTAANAGTGLLGRPTPDSEVVRLPRAELESLGATSAQVVSVALTPYLSAVGARLQDALPPREFTALDVPEARLPRAGAGRPVQGVLCVRLLSGAVDIHAGGEVRPAGADGSRARILTEADWVVATEDSVLATSTCADGLADRSIWPAVDAFLSRAMEAFGRRWESATAAERARWRDRAFRDTALVGEAQREFAAVLAPRLLAEARLSGLDPAVAVATLVGERLGIEVTPPARADRGRRADPVVAIARASRFRTRTVRLEAQWWREDVGPLVGFLKAGETPVALLPERSGYLLHDPTSDRKVAVDETVAKELRLDARMFYRPLPDHPLGGLDLLRFAARGVGRDIGVLTLCGVVVALLGLLTPVLTGRILGDLVPRAARGEITQWAIILLAVAVVSAALSMVQNLAALRTEGKVDMAAQAGVWDRLMSLPAPFFRRYPIGELSSAALGVNGIRDALSGVAVSAVLAFVFGLVNLGLMLWYDVVLGLIAFAVIVAGAAVSLWLGSRQIREQRAVIADLNAISSTTFQFMSGLAKLRIAAAEDRAYGHWAARFAQMRRRSYTARTLQNRLTVFNAGYAILAPAFIFGYIGLVRDGDFSTATFLSFNVAFLLFLGATLQLTGTGITVLAIVPMFEQLKPILEAVPEVDSDKTDPGELSGEVEVSHVRFRYAEDAPLVLDDVSFVARPGEFVAIVGPSGCGKSTLLRLLLGFEAPESGAVLYDDQQLPDLDAGAVRRQCGVVLQQGQLFAGDILSNIVGSSLFTADDAWEAADMAGLREDIEAMPMGMNTILSEGASTLSGGQRQRLMIARALIARPRIVFFDEATSALDNRTQRIVTESMRRLHATRIVIAHRLSTIQDADRIVVMDRGRVVQHGTFEELMAQEGMFRNLAVRQIV